MSAAVAAMCVGAAAAPMSATVDGSVMHEGREIRAVTLANGNGMTVRLCNYAATLTDVVVPDRNGDYGHVVLGFDSMDQYFGRHPKFGATVGRYANRIRDARICLDGQTYDLDRNSKGHCIHGGEKGFNRQVFDIDTVYAVEDTAVAVFSYRSPHLEGGFPGNVDVMVAYRLTDRNELILEYTASTDRPTVVNLTNHSYFNLAGCDRSVLDHEFMLMADSIVAVDDAGLPTGELTPVDGTAYDLRGGLTGVRDRVMAAGKGYDVCYRLNKPDRSLGLAAVVTDPVSGRMLRAYTTEPGMQFYVPASNLDYVTGHGGRSYGRYYGFCLEMQHYPDSPNHPHFPSTRLVPGREYRQTTVYEFGLMSE